MRRIGWLIGACLGLASPLAAQDRPDPGFTGRDLFDLAQATDPEISPDGRWIAYVRQSNDIMTDRAVKSLWLVDTRSGEQTPLVTEGNPSGPRWSPDGKRLAYAASCAGGSQLYVRWMAGGESARITGLPDSPHDIDWSPDGTRLAYLMTVPDKGATLGRAPAKPEGAKWADPLQVIDKVSFRADGTGMLKPGFDHLFVVDATGGAPRQLTFGAFNDLGPIDWTKGGQAILIAADRSPQWELDAFDTQIFAVGATSGKLTQLTNRKGLSVAPQVSPDGKTIAFLAFDDRGRAYEQTGAYVMGLDGSNPRPIAPAFDRSLSAVEWSRDGRSLVAQYDEGGKSRLARLGLDGRVAPLTDALVGEEIDRPYVGGAFSLASDGSIAFTRGDWSHPADVALLRGGRTATLTALNRQLDYKRLATIQPLAVTARDGAAIPVWLALPPGAVPGKKLPTILEIHGGPFAEYGPAFSTDFQLYAAAGYAVLFANPRGSSGYGQAFANGIDKNWPGPDYDDLMSAVDAAVAAGIADPDNLFVTGGSGGGTLTAWIVGKTHRFRAAAAQKPVVNMTSQVLNADGVPYFARYWFGKMPWEAPEAYWAHSPLSLVGNVTTPTLVVVGSEDYRTPVSEATQLYTALKLKGVPTALVEVPGASHGGLAARPSQAAAKASAILAWFDKYRKK
jgi:dipeptidyl aminopeptidase/acylaminoacyl peptidase